MIGLLLSPARARRTDPHTHKQTCVTTQLLYSTGSVYTIYFKDFLLNNCIHVWKRSTCFYFMCFVNSLCKYRNISQFLQNVYKLLFHVLQQLALFATQYSTHFTFVSCASSLCFVCHTIFHMLCSIYTCFAFMCITN